MADEGGDEIRDLTGRLVQVAEMLAQASRLMVKIAADAAAQDAVRAQERRAPPPPPERPPALREDGGWLTTAEAAERAKRSVWTVREVARAGLLHGHQPQKGVNPTWRFRLEAVDAFVAGTDGVEACGCERGKRRRR